MKISTFKTFIFRYRRNDSHTHYLERLVDLKTVEELMRYFKEERKELIEKCKTADNNTQHLDKQVKYDGICYIKDKIYENFIRIYQIKIDWNNPKTHNYLPMLKELMYYVNVHETLREYLDDYDINDSNHMLKHSYMINTNLINLLQLYQEATK